jgi:hypothetical protein
MRLFSWNPLRRKPVAARTAPRPRYRPRLEGLESRDLLSTFTVVLASDSGGPGGQGVSPTSGDLRYCIAQANASSAPTNVINFSPSVFGTPQTIVLDSATGPLLINGSQPLTIHGPPTETVSVSGGGATQVFQMTGGPVTLQNLDITQGMNANSDLQLGTGGGIYSSATLTLNNCTLDHDSASAQGGGIYSSATLTLNNCTLDYDSARAGGGIFSNGTLTLTHGTLDHDAANAGGGLANLGGTATLSGCTFDNDTAVLGGGGIFNTGTLTLTHGTLDQDSAGQSGGGFGNFGGSAVLIGCTLDNDTAGGGGGGVYSRAPLTLTNCTLGNDSTPGLGGGGLFVATSSTATVSNCTFSNDSAPGEDGGAVVNEGTVVATGCTFSNDPDSGLFNFTTDPGTGVATLTGCTFSNDGAVQGGGLANEGSAALTNCTFSDNTATGNAGGGGIWNAQNGVLTLTNCTVANNAAPNGSGGGIANNAGGTLTLINTIVAQNSAGSGPDIGGTINTADHDLIGDSTGATIITDQGGNLVGGNGNPVIDPRLGPLANHGGPTQTLALLRSSPAIGHADDSQAPATDQRGHQRTDHFGLATDIGAFEYP